MTLGFAPIGDGSAPTATAAVPSHVNMFGGAPAAAAVKTMFAASKRSFE